MADVSGAVLRGIGIPYTLTPEHIWEAESSYTEQSPLPGVPVAQQAGTLRLEASGTQSAGGSLDILTHRAGTPGPGGAGYVWKNTTDAATLYRGRDVQQITGTEAVVFVDGSASTYSAASDPDCTALPDGTVFAVFQATPRAASTTRVLIVAQRSPTADTWALTTLETVAIGSIGDGFHPTVAYNPTDGHVYAFAWTYDTDASLAFVRTYRAVNTGGTWTWSTVSKRASKSGVDISGSPGPGAAGGEVGRLRAGFAAGQCVLFAEYLQNTTTTGGAVGRNTLLQLASADNGLSFSDVTSNTSGAGATDTQYFDPDVVTIDDGLYLSCWSIVEFSTTRYLTHQWIALPSAFIPAVPRSSLTGAILGGSGSLVSFTGYNIDGVAESSNAVTTHSAATWLDEDGTVWVAFRVADSGDGGNGHVCAFFSTDRGRSWKWAGDADRIGTGQTVHSKVYSGPTAATTALDLSGCSSQGRQILIHRLINSTTTYDDSIRATYIGGSSTVTLPGGVAYPEVYQRRYWDQSYLGQVEPSTISGYTYTSTGTPSSVVEAAGWLVQTSSETAYITEAFTASVAGGFLFIFAYTPNSGGFLVSLDRGVRLILADGTDDYEVSLRMTTTQIRVVDENGSATLATSGTLSGAQEVMVAVSAGEVSVWYRALETGHDRTWTLLVDAGTLTNDSGSPSSAPSFQIGHIASGTASTHWRRWSIMASSAAGAMSAGQTNPADLLSREYPRRGRAVYVTDGVRLGAIDGAAVEGDAYLIAADAEFPVERILHSYSPDSRVLWKGTAPGGNTAAAEAVIAFQLNPDDPGSASGTAGMLDADLIFLTLEGINFGQFVIEYTASSSSPSWSTLATVDSRIRCDDADLRNLSITLPSSGTNTNGDKVFLSVDECVGWTGQIGTASGISDDGGLSNGFRVVSNSGGLLDLQSGPRPRFTVALSPSGTGRTIGTNTLQLCPDRVTVVINTAGLAFRGLRLRITSALVYGQALQIGRLLIGHVHAFGTMYSRGRQIEMDPGTITEDSPDGVRRFLALDRALRAVRLAWTDGIDQNSLWIDGTAPDHISGSTTSGNAPLGAEADVPVALQNLFARIGAGTPVVYLPRIVRSADPATDVIVLNRREQHLTMYLDGTIQVESVLGEEVGGTADLSGEVLRVATVAFVEAI